MVVRPYHKKMLVIELGRWLGRVSTFFSSMRT